MQVAVELGDRGGALAVGVHESAAQLLEVGDLVAARPVLEVAGQIVGEGVEPGEGRGEDHPAGGGHLVGQQPTVGQLRAGRRRLVVLDQGQAGVAQGVEARGHGELGVAPEGGDALGVDPELLGEVEGAAASGQLDDVGGALDGLEQRRAVVPLDQAGDVALGDLVASG